MNQQSILPIITLEDFNGNLLGQSSFLMHICTCLGKDWDTEKEKFYKKGEPCLQQPPGRTKWALPTNTNSSTLPKVSGDREHFTLQVQWHECCWMMQSAPWTLSPVRQPHLLKILIKQALKCRNIHLRESTKDQSEIMTFYLNPHACFFNSVWQKLSSGWMYS